MTITPKFDFKHKVYIKTDPDKSLHFVISYTLYPNEILYNVSGMGGVTTCYDFELDDYDNRVV